MKKKRNILIIAGLLIVALVIARDVKNRIDISNLIESLGYGYEEFCTEEFVEAMDTKVYTVISSTKKKSKLASMMEDNSAFKHNGITSSFYIYTKENIGNSLERDNGYVEANVVYIDKDGNHIIDPQSAIKVRGNSTSGAPKKPYNVKFKEKQDLFGFGKAKKWNLLAECFDPTLMRNKMFLDLAQELGLENTSKCHYVELYMDGEYRGCYLLTEAVEVGKNRVDIDTDNGEYLFEMEREREENGATYIMSEHKFRFVASDPDELDEDQVEELTKIIDDFDSALYSGDYSKVEEYLDIESFVKVYLLNEFAKTADFGYSSVNFYNKDGKLYAGPVWDFDLSSGNYAPERIEKEYWIDGKSYTYMFCRYTNGIYDKLFSYPEFNEEYLECFKENYDLLKSTFEEGGFIDKTLDDYRWLFDKNFEEKENGGAGWIIDYRHTNIQFYPYDTYDENLDYLRTWLEDRLNWLSRNS